MFLNFMLLKHLTCSSHKVLSVSLTNSDFSHMSVHTTGSGEFDKTIQKRSLRATKSKDMDVRD